MGPKVCWRFPGRLSYPSATLNIATVNIQLTSGFGTRVQVRTKRVRVVEQEPAVS